jgi:molybdopterin synthase catalytic subunit
MPVSIRTQRFDPWQEMQRHQAKLCAGKYGATASFIGTMRDFNQGDQVNSMTLEHYPGMTESYLDKICTEANTHWQLLDCLIVHRVGVIKPADPIVLTCAWSAHRAAAFDACRYMMEELKSHAPFWKKEGLTNGHRWVDKNT